MRKGRKAVAAEQERHRSRFLGLGCLLLLGLLAGGLYGLTRWELHIQKGRAEEIVEREIRAMSFRSANEAYWLYSQRTRKSLRREDLEAFCRDRERFIAFSYYQPGTSTTTSWAMVEDPPDEPGGEPIRRMRLEGTIQYQDGTQGVYRTELELEPGGWRLNSLDVTAPPGKKK